VKKPLNEEDSGFLRNVLKLAVDSGAAVRALAFKQALPGLKERTEHFINAVCNLDPSQKLTSACHTSPSNFAMSHHQKEVVLCRGRLKDSCAYVGGMDLAIDRWDDWRHDAETKEGRNFGWHDIQVRVRGNAVVQLWANFKERWEAERKKEETLECPVPNWNEKDFDKGKGPKMGNQYVQVLRTVGPAGGANPARFMPQGERTVMYALKKAIERAERYIYIEEQFLWDCELADFIKAAMEKNDNLHLIIVMTAGCELPARLGHYALYLRSEFLKKVTRSDKISDIQFGSTRVYPFGLFQQKHQIHSKGRSYLARPEIYVHSKLFIIDDRYVAIGSANVDARSLHIETELTLGIVDGEYEQVQWNQKVKDKDEPKTIKVCKFAKQLRERLWQEHLCEPTLISSDPLEVLRAQFPGPIIKGLPQPWPKSEKEAKDSQRGHLRCYMIPPRTQRTHRITGPMKRLIDRNDRKWW
jgi:phosphatidylserine/phosphatidylglycerophosphate/cardiolipin synthase-like enzyme